MASSYSLRIQTMQEDLARARGQKITPVADRTVLYLTKKQDKQEAKAVNQPEPEVFGKNKVQAPKIIVRERIVRVPDEEKINEIRLSYEEEVSRLKAQYEKRLEEKPKIQIVEKPVIRVVEKIVEKPVIRVVEKIVEKPVYRDRIKKSIKPKETKRSVSQKDTSRNKKQIFFGFGLLTSLLVLAGATYLLLRTPGQKIVIETGTETETETKTEIPKPEPDIKTDEGPIASEPSLSLPLRIPESFSQNEPKIISLPNNKLVLMIEAPSTLETISALTLWEKTIIQDLGDLFQEKPLQKASFKTNGFEFPGVIIRYQDTRDLENSLHYTFNKGRIIVTTGATDMRILINSLWITN